MLKLSFGAAAFALMITENTPRRAPEQGLLPTVAWQIFGENQVSALDGGGYTASAALNWAKSLAFLPTVPRSTPLTDLPSSRVGVANLGGISGLSAKQRPIWRGGAI